MSEKEGKKSTIKNNKKVSKDKKSITLKLNNDVEIPAESIYKEDSRVFNISDIDIDRISVSDKKLYNKNHDSYKHYVFYEDDDDDEYIPLKITLLDVPGYYNIFNDDGKTINFKSDNNSLEKNIDIFDHIGEILKIDLDHYFYEDMRGEVYFKAKVSDETFLEEIRIKQLIQFQMKDLSIIVEYYYKYNLFTTIIIKIYLKMRIIILKYFYKSVDIPFFSIIN